MYRFIVTSGCVCTLISHLIYIDLSYCGYTQADHKKFILYQTFSQKLHVTSFLGFFHFSTAIIYRLKAEYNAIIVTIKLFTWINT